MSEAQSLTAVLDHGGGGAYANERGAAPNQQFVVVTRSEQTRLRTDQVPDVGGLLGLRRVHTDCSPPHLIMVGGDRKLLRFGLRAGIKLPESISEQEQRRRKITGRARVSTRADVG